MGVKGLWTLLEPVGKPVTLESLEGKVLAVDVSIWLHQVVHGMRDRDGEPVVNAHLLGIFHRVCKLLFYRIRPIFVFDGGVPELKKQTLVARRQQRADATERSEQATRKLVTTLLRQQAVGAVLGGSGGGGRGVGGRRRDEPDLFDLPPVPDTDDFGYAADYDRSMNERADLINAFTEQFQNPEEIDPESESFQNLPPEIQYELLMELREVRKQSRWARARDMPDKTEDFSNFQIKRMMHRSRLTRHLDDVRQKVNAQASGDILTELGHSTAGGKSQSGGDEKLGTAAKGWGMGGGTVEANRVVSDDTLHYILIKGLSKKSQQAAAQNCLAAVTQVEDSSPVYTTESVSQKEDGSEVKGSEDDNTTLTEQNTTHEPNLNRSSPDKLAYTDSDERKPPQSQLRNEDSDLWSTADCDVIVLDISEPGDSKGKISKMFQSTDVDVIQISDSEKDKEVVDYSKEGGFIRDDESDSDDCQIVEDTMEISYDLSVRRNQGIEKPVSSRDGKMNGGYAASEAVTEPSQDMMSEQPTERDDGHHQLQWIRGEGTSQRSDVQEASERGHHEGQRAVDSHEENGTRTASEQEHHGGPLQRAVSSHDGSDAQTVSEREISEGPLQKAVGEGSQERNDAESSDALTSAEKDRIRDTRPVDVGSSSRSCIDNHSGSTAMAEDACRHQVQGRGKIRASVDSISDDDGFSEVPEIELSEGLLPSTSVAAIVVSQGDREDTASQTHPSGSGWQPNTEDLEELQTQLDEEASQLQVERGRLARQAASITDQMAAEAQELLQLFGVPYIVSPMEAEAQCAYMDFTNQTQGTVTDDSDIWLFGGQKVYKNMFNQGRHVEYYNYESLQSQLLLDRKQLINLAFLCGSDYTEGIEKVGPVTAMEIIAEFPGQGLDVLRSLKSWWTEAQKVPLSGSDTKIKAKLRQLKIPNGFPSTSVVDAYLKPEVDESLDRISWEKPDLDLLRKYAAEKFGWSQAKADESLLPVMKKLSESSLQRHITNYFTVDFGEARKIKSKRVKRVLNRLQNPDAEASGAAADATPSTSNTTFTAGSRQPKASPIRKTYDPRKSKMANTYEYLKRLRESVRGESPFAKRPRRGGGSRGRRGAGRGGAATVAPVDRPVAKHSVDEVQLSESSSDDE